MDKNTVRQKTVRNARSIFREHVAHREQTKKSWSGNQVRDAIHKASRLGSPRRTWAGSGRRLAVDCVTKEKPWLRRSANKMTRNTPMCAAVQEGNNGYYTARQCGRSGCGDLSKTRGQAKKGPRRPIVSQTLTILASSHQRPKRHAHRGLRHDGVPVLRAQPVPARLRQLRVVVQELERDDDQAVTPRPEPQHAAMSDQNRALGQEADWPPRKKRELSITGIFPARELFSITV